MFFDFENVLFFVNVFGGEFEAKNGKNKVKKCMIINGDVYISLTSKER